MWLAMTKVILTTVLDYFTKVLEDDLKAIVKPQYVDQLPRAIKGPVKTVKPLIEAKSELGNMQHILDVLGEQNIGSMRALRTANRYYSRAQRRPRPRNRPPFGWRATTVCYCPRLRPECGCLHV